MNNLTYEQRTIRDFKGNVYPIWVIHKIDKLNIKRQLVVFDNENDFIEYWDNIKGAY